MTGARWARWAWPARDGGNRSAHRALSQFHTYLAALWPHGRCKRLDHDGTDSVALCPKRKEGGVRRHTVSDCILRAARVSVIIWGPYCTPHRGGMTQLLHEYRAQGVAVRRRRGRREAAGLARAISRRVGSLLFGGCDSAPRCGLRMQKHAHLILLLCARKRDRGGQEEMCGRRARRSERGEDQLSVHVRDQNRPNAADL